MPVCSRDQPRQLARGVLLDIDDPLCCGCLFLQKLLRQRPDVAEDERRDLRRLVFIQQPNGFGDRAVRGAPADEQRIECLRPDELRLLQLIPSPSSFFMRLSTIFVRISADSVIQPRSSCSSLSMHHEVLRLAGQQAGRYAVLGEPVTQVFLRRFVLLCRKSSRLI